MCKKAFISALTIFFIISLSNISISMNFDTIFSENKFINMNRYEDKIFINNISNKNIDVNVKDMSILKGKINIGQIYDYYAILTINIVNNGLNDIELCDIDIYPYQGSKSTKYFVKTSDDNIKGFIGTIRPRENKDIKIGIALYNQNDNIKLNLITKNENSKK